jgi:hypothetical protein
MVRGVLALSLFKYQLLNIFIGEDATVVLTGVFPAIHFSIVPTVLLIF